MLEQRCLPATFFQRAVTAHRLVQRQYRLLTHKRAPPSPHVSVKQNENNNKNLTAACVPLSKTQVWNMVKL